MYDGTHRYKGDEFPEYIGADINVKDCYDDLNNPCYSIRFVGESVWYDNMGDEDIEWL